MKKLKTMWRYASGWEKFIFILWIVGILGWIPIGFFSSQWGNAIQDWCFAIVAGHGIGLLLWKTARMADIEDDLVDIYHK